jgi:L-alanine-DL-glutamate epimerase-like enolase superfamily enzyme
LAAALPAALYVEYLTPAAYIDDMLVEPFVLDADGCLTIPAGPGLGVELNRETLRRFSRG